MTYFARQRGSASIYFVLIAGVLLFGLMTFAVDYGRFYLVQAELQTAADAAALAAAKSLSGTFNADLHAAAQITASFDNTDTNDNRFNLRQNQIGEGATNLPTQISVDYFSTRLDAITPGATGGATGADAKYVRVQISAQVPVLFGQFINANIGPTQTVIASAVAGISSPICSACGIDAIAIVDPSAGSDPVNFGLTPGNFYTFFLTNALATSTGCTVGTQPALNGTDSNILVEYSFLNHVPNGPVVDPDSTLFELGAGGMQQADSTTLDLPELAISDSYTACPGQSIICGLNTRFGVDATSNACGDGTIAAGEFSALAQIFSTDTDTGIGDYSAGVGLQDFATEYDGNVRRVITVPVVDATDTLNVLNFVQFLVEPSDTVGEGLDPSLATGAFRAQYITTISGSSPVPLRCGGVGGACSVQFGVGRTVLH